MERLADRMRPFISVEGTESSEGLSRTSTYFYPLDAVREAVMNAFVHRDWTRSIEVEVVNYSDRLEVTSPGALQNSMNHLANALTLFHTQMMLNILQNRAQQVFTFLKRFGKIRLEFRQE